MSQPVNEILYAADLSPTDLILLGNTVNENPILEFLFGSAARDVIRKSSVSILLVPVRE